MDFFLCLLLFEAQNAFADQNLVSGLLGLVFLSPWESILLLTDGPDHPVDRKKIINLDICDIRGRSHNIGK